MVDRRLKEKNLLFSMKPIFLMSIKDKHFCEPCFEVHMCVFVKSLQFISYHLSNQKSPNQTKHNLHMSDILTIMQGALKGMLELPCDRRVVVLIL